MRKGIRIVCAVLAFLLCLLPCKTALGDAGNFGGGGDYGGGSGSGGGYGFFYIPLTDAQSLSLAAAMIIFLIVLMIVDLKNKGKLGKKRNAKTADTDLPQNLHHHS